MIVEQALVIDGTGEPGRIADVAVDAGRITAVGGLAAWRAEHRIDGAGKVLAPGFIDVHSHDDVALLRTPDMRFKLSQGVTTVIAGNCGISVAPLRSAEIFPPPYPVVGDAGDFRFPTVAAYRDAFEARPAALNVALLAGHSSLRLNAMGAAYDEPASPESIALMSAELDLALRQGCIGLSSGLEYPPAEKATTEEVIALAAVLREHPSAVYTTHMRDEGDHVIEAVKETLETGRRSGAPVVISHHKCAGPRNHGRSVETLRLIAEAQKTQKVSLDVYPYTAGSSSLLPTFLRDAVSVLVTWSDPHPECGGRMLDDIAAEWGCAREEAAARLDPAGAIYFQIDEEDLRRILAFPHTMVGSDGLPGRKRPHPRLWGTFPRVLARYVREEKLLSLAAAVHKMTGLSARTFGLSDRGLVRQGYAADLVLFDAETVADVATYDDPEVPSAGIELVFVNGVLSWSGGRETGTRPGQFLTH